MRRTFRQHRAAAFLIALGIAACAALVAALLSTASSNDTVAAGAEDRAAGPGNRVDMPSVPTTPPKGAKVAGLGPARAAPGPPGTDVDTDADRSGGTSTTGASGTRRAPVTGAAAGGADAGRADPGASPPPPPPERSQHPAEVDEPPTSAPPDVRCVVRLHGKGGNGGAATTDAAGRVVLRPAGNAAAWGGRQWLYFPEGSYASARATVEDATVAAGCTKVVVIGFSNGAAFAAKLYCRGERFGGTLVGVIVDDPVPDQATQGCAPGRGVRLALYWTGALGQAGPGWSCAAADWTCEGGTTVGIDAYAAALGVAVKQSPMGGHHEYTNPPELSAWL